MIDQGDISIIDLPSFKLEEAKVYREWKNIDILIELPKHVIVIENKIYSGEHSNQLQRYKRIVEKNFIHHKKIYVFLTPLETNLQTIMNILIILMKI